MQMRLQSARRLLARTNLPLLQIAIDCGFTDESHLIRAFRKDIGTTPVSTAASTEPSGIEYQQKATPPGFFRNPGVLFC